MDVGEYTLTDDLTVFGVRIKNFPAGIGGAFDGLIKMLPGGFDRSFYGISEWNGNGMIYRAAALETYKGEADQYPCERYTIEKGAFLYTVITDWRPKTSRINGVFGELMKDVRFDRTKPSVEWYKNEQEMWCMVRKIL